MKVKVIPLPYIFQVLYVLCFTGTRYQVSVYRTIGPLVTCIIRVLVVVPCGGPKSLPAHLFFFIQFNVPFKIILLIETSQSIGGAKREYPGKTT